MNLDLPMWNDERLRRALSLAVDRDAISKVIYGSFGKIAATPDWQFFWDEEPTADSGTFGPWWRFAPDEARSLLDAAGVPDFSFDLLYYLGYGGASVVELLVDQLRGAGIEMRPRSVEYTEFNSQWTARKGEAHAYDGWVASGSTAEHNVHGLHHSASGANRYRIKDAQVDAWAEQHQVKLDPDTRLELARRVWERVYDQVYRIDKPTNYSAELMQPWVQRAEQLHQPSRLRRALSRHRELPPLRLGRCVAHARAGGAAHPEPVEGRVRIPIRARAEVGSAGVVTLKFIGSPGTT